MSSIATIHVIMQMVLAFLVASFVVYERCSPTHGIWVRRIMWVFVLIILGVLGGLTLQASVPRSTVLARACSLSAAIDLLVCVLAVIKLYFLFHDHPIEGYAPV